MRVTVEARAVVDGDRLARDGALVVAVSLQAGDVLVTLDGGGLLRVSATAEVEVLR